MRERAIVRRIAITACQITAFCMGTVPAHAQERMALRRDACAECRIDLGEPVILLDRTEQIAFGDLVLVFEGPSTFFAVSNTDRARAGVFEHSGRFVTTFGRQGAGPGEYRAIMNVVSGGRDSVFAVDPLLGRITVLDHSYQAARQIPSPAAISAVGVLRSGRLVMAGQMMTEHGSGYPFHVFDREGHHIRSFGVDAPVLRLGADRYLLRRLAPAEDGSFWSMRPNSYRIEKWRDDGRLLSVIDGRADWLEEGADPGFNPLYQMPPGTVRSIALTSDTLWIVAYAADPDWRPGRRTGGLETGSEPGFDVDEAFDTIIEAIDMTSGAVIGSMRFDEYLWPVHGSHRVYRVVVDEGEPYIAVWSPRVSTR